jgi:hypothetical protein
VFAGTGFNADTTLSVPGTAAVTGQITIDTKASDCTSSTGGVLSGRGMRLIPHTVGSLKASNNTPKKSIPVPAGIAFAGLVLAGFLGRSSRRLRQLGCLIALVSLGVVLSACGGGGGSSGSTGSTGGTVANPAKGTYTITFTGTDSVTTTITSTAQFSLVIK